LSITENGTGLYRLNFGNRALQFSNTAFHPSVISTTFSLSDRVTQVRNKKKALPKAVSQQN